ARLLSSAIARVYRCTPILNPSRGFKTQSDLGPISVISDATIAFSPAAAHGFRYEQRIRYAPAGGGISPREPIASSGWRRGDRTRTKLRTRLPGRTDPDLEPTKRDLQAKGPPNAGRGAQYPDVISRPVR